MATDERKANEAQSGNASNPSPQNNGAQPASNQLLNVKAEKYLRESANIEDLPDPQEEKQAEDALKK